MQKSVYLIIEPGRRYGFPAQVQSFSIKDLRHTKPALRAGQIAVKVRLILDPSIFDEYIPVVEAFIEGAAVITPPGVVVIPNSDPQ